MKSRVLKDNAELARIFGEWCDRADDIRVVSAWATTDCGVFGLLSAARQAISTLVVGLDFCTTSPDFLRSFRSMVRIGKAPGNSTFHPKIYLFSSGHSFCCILGSSNFTSGGFGGNVELNVCVTGRHSDPFFSQISTFIDEREQQSKTILDPEITDYQLQFDRMAAARARLAKFRGSKKANEKAQSERSMVSSGLHPPEQLNTIWSEYIVLILAQENRPGLVIQGTQDDQGYLGTSESCQALFRRHRSLTRMSLDDRRFVGGTVKGAGWFGSMRGNGFFMKRLNNAPQSLDAALRHIPITGRVTKSSFDAFVANYQWEHAGVGTASRLLAMKRPDLFLCIDSQNRSNIAKAFSVTSSSVNTFAGYWELMLRIWKCPWWRAPRPLDPIEQRIWQARVALLDSVYYHFES